MALTALQLAAVRAHIGSAEPPTDVELEAAYERLGTAEAVALEVIRGRLANMRARPAVLKVDGDHSEDWTKNLDLLTKQEASLAALADVAAGTGSVQVARLTRVGRSR